MSRNYGLGSRVMSDAGRMALERCQERGEVSYATVATISNRWESFCNFAKEGGVKKMENVSRDLVIAYGKSLSEKVSNGELSASTAQNAVSAVNTVLNSVPEKAWASVSPTKDCGIAERTHVREEAPATQTTFEKAVANLADRPREQALVVLCREFGLRSKEASLLQPEKAFREALAAQKITVELGTKGGRVREIPITSHSQIKALRTAIDAKERSERCLVPEGKSYATWRDSSVRFARDAVKEAGGKGLHDLRAAYACERYETLTGSKAPVVAGERTVSKDIDHDARKTISEELGHGRIEVVSSYVGSSK